MKLSLSQIGECQRRKLFFECPKICLAFDGGTSKTEMTGFLPLKEEVGIVNPIVKDIHAHRRSKGRSGEGRYEPG